MNINMAVIFKTWQNSIFSQERRQLLGASPQTCTRGLAGFALHSTGGTVPRSPFLPSHFKWLCLELPNKHLHWSAGFRTQEYIGGTLLTAKLHLDRCPVLPMRGQKPQIWPKLEIFGAPNQLPFTDRREILHATVNPWCCVLPGIISPSCAHSVAPAGPEKSNWTIWIFEDPDLAFKSVLFHISFYLDRCIVCLPG